MSMPNFYRLHSVSVLDISGVDAEKIVHNLTTNDIKKLAAHQGCESFITDIKGKTLGHVLVYRGDQAIRLIGAPGQSARVAAHVEKYTIVEDALPQVLDEQLVALVVEPGSVQSVNPAVGQISDELREVALAELHAAAYGVPWLGPGTVVLLCASATAAATEQQLIDRSMVKGEEAEFHRRRIAAGFPWCGVDFDDRNLPQEIDRDATAISFTKGCYLGQETVARLDAMGQVQKKLVRWSLNGAIPTAGAELRDAEKVVGRLTSVTRSSENQAIAIGMARRSHFEPGARAIGVTQEADEFTAVVI
jgi:folate-binding protein YgfZ